MIKVSTKFVVTLISLGMLFAGMTLSVFGENFHYYSHGKRDPFVPLVGREKPAVMKLEDITSAEEVKLEGIVGTGDKRSAIVNGEIMEEGDKVGEIEIKKITKRAVTMTISDAEYTIPLYEEGGGKSE